MATQVQLTEAEEALHRLLTGAQSVSVSTAEGDSVTYTAANARDLRTYIATLKVELGGPKPLPIRATTNKGFS